MLIEDFVIPQALFKIITETKILAIGSAIVHPNAQIKIAAVMAPTEPNKSPITCKKHHAYLNCVKCRRL